MKKLRARKGLRAPMHSGVGKEGRKDRERISVEVQRAGFLGEDSGACRLVPVGGRGGV